MRKKGKLVVTEADREFAAQCSAAMVKYLETMGSAEIVKVRAKMAAGGAGPEESRDWKSVGRSWQSQPRGVVRTRTGYFYR